ncbi:penicillin-binding protein activator [Marinomonas spartinae]|uniref:penicillin-binding protein activator n=1 Tax=Marinomonas spartinae TaxID=1792290 RepID=UPI001F31D328|nr:penicillin-binding protein activator [Marinomonas spartinae]
MYSDPLASSELCDTMLPLLSVIYKLMSLINYRIISLTVCTFLLSACSSVNLNTQPGYYSPDAYSQKGETKGDELPPSIYHPLPTKAPKELADSYNKALQLYRDGQFLLARDALTDKLLDTQSIIRFKAHLLAAAIASELDDPSKAMDMLNQASKLPAADSPDNQNLLNKTKATILEHTNNWPEVVKVRLDLLEHLPKGEGQENEAKLWRAVQNLTEAEMAELSQTDSPVLKGFLTISGILRNQSLSIEQQLKAFKAWQQAHPDHPAAIDVPQDFRVIANLNDMAPKKIVLMLPMTGKLESASQAIVNGFFSAYYHQKQPRAQIAVVNTDNYKNIAEALKAADAQNPDVIIGPLKKSNVTEINRLSPQHPVIALNQVTDNQRIPNVYHFSLNAEDDINELISFAKQAGATRAAILSSQDTWALRQSDEFRKAAKQANITITGDLSYQDTSKGRQQAVQKLLLINESKSRIYTIQKWIGEQVDTEVRPRQDLNYIFYAGKLSDAKQIRPLLDFYFASDVPMLASSTLNDSPPEQGINYNDIERILFAEIPAIVNKDSALKDVSSGRDSNILRRLQALGADAYLLANRYPLFVQLPTTRLSANTGIITMDQYGTFHRRPEIMTYRNGQLVHAVSTQFFPKKEETEQ